MSNMAEEDGDIVESWEDLEDNVALDKKLNEMKPKKKQGDSAGTFTLPARPIEDTTRTPFTPQVKILKREPNANNAGNANQGAQAKPTKTLEQREAEYAEARLRILGQDYVSNNPHSQPGNNPNNQPSNNPNNQPSNNFNSQPSGDHNKSEQQQRLVPKFEGMKVTENVVRQPRGPDGSKGFTPNNVRR